MKSLPLLLFLLFLVYLAFVMILLRWFLYSEVPIADFSGAPVEVNFFDAYHEFFYLFKPTVLSYCNNNLRFYNDEVVEIFNVTLDVKKAIQIDDIRKPKHYFKPAQIITMGYNLSFISMQCKITEKPNIYFDEESAEHFKQIYDSLIFNEKQIKLNLTILSPVMFIISRQQNNDLFHTINDLYVSYIVASFLKIPLSDITIIFIDSHPLRKLDDIWSHIFNQELIFKLTYLMNQRQRYYFAEHFLLVPKFGISPLLQLKWSFVPLIKNFRELILKKYGFKWNKITESVSCDTSMRIVYILNDHMKTHEDNRISNERELIHQIKLALKIYESKANIKINFTEISFNSISFFSQLQMVLNTTILIGLHSKSLMISLFLPHNAGLFEIFPWIIEEPKSHFEALAGWIGLQYDKHVEQITAPPSTEIPPVTPEYVCERITLLLDRYRCSN